MTVQRQAHTSKRLINAQTKIDSLVELRRWTYLMQYRGLGLDYKVVDKDFAHTCGINLVKALEGMKALSGLIEEAQEHIDEFGTIPESLNYSSKLKGNNQ